MKLCCVVRALFALQITKPKAKETVQLHHVMQRTTEEEGLSAWNHLFLISYQ